MAYEWQTTEQASVTLGISARTLARRIAQGKVENRLREGRREVFICLPDEPAETSDDSVATSGVLDAASQINPMPIIDDLDSRSAPAASPFPSEAPLENDNTSLILAEDRAHRAEMTLAVVQQSVHLISNEAQRARVGARWAWAMVAVLGTAIVVAVGWTTSLITRSSTTADALRDRLIESRDSQQKAAEKLGRLEADLAKANDARAQADGQLEEVRRQMIQTEQRAADEARRAQAIEAASHVFPSPMAAPTTAPATQPGEHASANDASAGVVLGR
jgi:hypothetical protein